MPKMFPEEDGLKHALLVKGKRNVRAFVAQRCSWDLCLYRYQQLLKGLVWTRGFVILMMHKRIDSQHLQTRSRRTEILACRSEGY